MKFMCNIKGSKHKYHLTCIINGICVAGTTIISFHKSSEANKNAPEWLHFAVGFSVLCLSIVLPTRIMINSVKRFSLHNSLQNICRYGHIN